MGKKKIAILGGGPSGLQSALTGIEEDLDVLVFEKKKVGENFCCAEGFFDSLKILPPPEKGVCFKVNELIIKAKNDYSVDCSNLNLWMLNRKEWQKSLADEAEAKGALIKENAQISPEDLKDLKKSFDWIIDATGTNSLTNKYYKLNFSLRENSAPAYQVTLKGDFSYLKNKMVAGIMPYYTGYYWIFPRSEREANVGIGFFKQELGENNKVNLKKELESILKKESLSDYEVTRTCGGIISVQMLDKLVYDNIILTGDAAGLCSPLHGGGIDSALISGDLAVKSIIKKVPFYYKENLMKHIGNRLRLESKIVNIWGQLGYEGVEELLELLLTRKSLLDIPKLFKYKNIINKHRNELVSFYKGFFEGDWTNYTVKDSLFNIT